MAPETTHPMSNHNDRLPAYSRGQTKTTNLGGLTSWFFVTSARCGNEKRHSRLLSLEWPSYEDICTNSLSVKGHLRVFRPKNLAAKINPKKYENMRNRQILIDVLIQIREILMEVLLWKKILKVCPLTIWNDYILAGSAPNHLLVTWETHFVVIHMYYSHTIPPK
jgi:hypothetical protein